MKTPITDELNMKFHEDESASFVDSYVGMRKLARRLEQDREIFRQALIRIYTSPLTEASETILQAFREASAFPGEMHEP